MIMALVDCKLRVVINVEYSHIGYGYPSIYAELKLNKTYLNMDCVIGDSFKMKPKNFITWWEAATPKTIAEAAIESGIDEQALRDLLEELFVLASKKGA